MKIKILFLTYVLHSHLGGHALAEADPIPASTIRHQNSSSEYVEPISPRVGEEHRTADGIPNNRESTEVRIYPASAAATELTCPPVQTTENLEKFREMGITKVLAGEFGDVKKAMSSCFGAAIPGCMKDLNEFNETKRNQRDEFTLKSFEMDNMYSKSQQLSNRRVEYEYILKSTDDLPKEFVPRPGFIKFPDDILNLAKKKGWKALAYKTRSAGGFDHPPNLTLVAIPGRDKDIYLQISPKPDDNHQSTKDDPLPKSKNISHGQNTLTIITVDKTKKPPVGELRLFNPTRDQPEGSLKSRDAQESTSGELEHSYRWQDDKTFTRDCLQCHTTPLRSISPRGYLVTNGSEKRMAPEDEKLVTEINEMMLVEGVSWGHAKVEGRPFPRGPNISSHPLGWSSPNSLTRKKEFIDNCAKATYDPDFSSVDRTFKVNLKRETDEPIKHDWQKVSQAMSCTQCHNNSARGILHSAFNDSEIKFKILVDRSMPPGADLTMDDRIALYNCLKAERVTLRSKWATSGEWMKKDQCHVPTSPSNSKRPQSPTRGIKNESAIK